MNKPCKHDNISRYDEGYMCIKCYQEFYPIEQADEQKPVCSTVEKQRIQNRLIMDWAEQ